MSHFLVIADDERTVTILSKCFFQSNSSFVNFIQSSNSHLMRILGFNGITGNSSLKWYYFLRQYIFQNR